MISRVELRRIAHEWRTRLQRVQQILQPSEWAVDDWNRFARALTQMVRAYGSTSWDVSWTAFLRTADALDRLQVKEREMALLPVTLPGGKKLSLTAGGQNELVKKIIGEFCPRFTPGGVVAYLGDTGKKRRHVEAGYLERLGVEIDEHGKMPDVVVHLPERNWLVLIEAVTSHGPIGLKRPTS